MGFTGFGGGAGDGNLDGFALNQRLREGAPVSGSGQNVAGAGSQASAQLNHGIVYVIIASGSMNFVSTGSAAGAAATTLGDADPYWPADLPKYHLAKSGSTDYVVVSDFAGGNVNAFIYPAGD